MPIASLLLEVAGGTEATVADRLGRLTGVELRGSGAGQLVVTTETPDLATDRALTERIRDTDGVVTAHVVFFTIEDCLPCPDAASDSDGVGVDQEDRAHG